MLPVTVDAQACYLLDCEEAWGKSISGEFAVRSAIETGRSQIENRSTFAATTLLTLSWRIYVEGAEARRWRAALRAYGNQPVLAPFWPAACLLADLPASRWAGGLRLFFEPGEPGVGTTIYQVLAGATAPTSFAPSADCMVVPLAWSRFDSLPHPEAADGDEAMEIDLKTVENGPVEYAIAPIGVDLTAGPVVGTLTPPLLDIIADWGAGVSAAGIDLRVERERIGFGRAEVIEYVDQPARQRQKITLPPLGDEIAKLVALYAQIGNVGSCWVPGAFAEARLAADSRAASAVITVDDPGYLTDLQYIALVDDEAIAPRRIESRTGAALTLQSSPGAFGTGTAVCALLLVRFTAAKLKIIWTTPAVASAQVEMIELPTEVVVPAGETVGTTIGDLGTPVWLYQVSDGDLTWRYTSYESALAAGALGTFDPRPIEHGKQISGINLAAHSLELTIGYWPGNPFWRQRFDRHAPALTVAVYEGRLANPAAAKQIFTGMFRPADYAGGKCSGKIVGISSAFDMQGPVALISKDCWTEIYSPLCGLSAAELSIASTLSAADPDGTLHFGASGSSAFPAVGADHFAYGYAIRRLGDGSRRIYSIRTSAATDGTASLAIKIAGSVSSPTFPESGWTLVPGCSKLFSRCAELANTANFRGLPRLPKSNPVMTSESDSTNSGSKK